MPHSKLTSKGQITIPGSVRKKLNLNTGDTVEFSEENGRFFIEPVSKSVEDVYGILFRENQKPVSIDRMNIAIKNRFRK